MKSAFAVILVTASWALLSLAACGDDVAGSPSPDDGGAEATADAGDPTFEDAASDVDVAPSKCTEDDICHTDLPPNQYLRDVWGDGEGVAWAVTEQGNILRWDGDAWAIHHTVTGSLFAIWGTSPTDIWIGGEHGQLWHGQGPSSKDLTWTSVAIAAFDGVPILSIWGSSASDFWAVGGYVDDTVAPPDIQGRVLHQEGGSGVVFAAPRAIPTTFTKVWGTSSRNVWIGGHDLVGHPARLGLGVMLRPDPAAGAGFAEVTLPTVERAEGARPIEAVTGGAVIGDELFVFAFSESWNSLVRGASRDGSAPLTWQEQRFPIHPSYRLHAAWGSQNDAWLAGEYGRLRHWDGAAWSLPRIAIGRLPLTNTFRAIWGESSDDLWFVGDRIALHRSKKKSP